MRHFNEINLRFNPFGELDAEERIQLALVDLSELGGLVGHKDTAIQFLGGHGRGKTTHLLALHSRFREIPYRKLHKRQAIDFPDSKSLFVDSIENMPFYRRLALYKRLDHLVFTTHKDLSVELGLMGFRVVTRVISQNDPEAIRSILQRRIQFARLNERPAPELTAAMLEELICTFGDNIRAMEQALYQHFNALR